MTNFYLDFEMTGIRRNTSPISIAVVSDDPEKIFYGEFTDYHEEKVDEWVRANVLSKLMLMDLDAGQKKSFCTGGIGIKGPISYIGNELAKWFADVLPEPPEKANVWADCYAHDWILFLDTLSGTLPASINYFPFDFTTLIEIRRPGHADTTREDLLYFTPTIEDIMPYELQARARAAAQSQATLKHNALWDALVLKRLVNIYY